MYNSGFGKTNTKVYKFNMKKLTKSQNNEIYNSISGGALKSSVSDFIKFKNFHKLLKEESILLFKQTYFFNYNKKDKIYIISHSGDIQDNVSNLNIQYNTSWVCKDITIKLSTNFI